MTKLLHVSPDQALPVAVLQDSTTIFGRKRVGKSNNAVVMVEEYLDLHGQVIVMDPKGDWWGMTSSADGKAEGYPLVIIGGKHGTPAVELNPLAGATTAEWVIKTGYSVILDLSQLRPRETEQFCSAFLERIRRLKVETPGPILIVIDEADELAPEDKNARMAIIDTYAAVVWMVKRGGFAGIGTLVITQRPASLSKNVTTQSETVIVLQVTGSQDVDAIAAALKHHVDGDTKKDRASALEELLRSIVRLDKGEAVIVSASPELKGQILTVPFRRRKTFDSGATPKFGEQPKAPKVVAKIALAQLSAEMEKAVAEAKANDPATLRTQLAAQAKRIKELEAAAEKDRAAAAAAIAKAEAATKVETKRVDVPVLKKGELARLERVVKAFDSLTSRFSGVQHEMGEAVRPVYDAIQKVLSASSAAAPIVRGDAGAAAVRADAHVRAAVPGRQGHLEDVARAEVDRSPRSNGVRSTTRGGSSGKLEERGALPATNRRSESSAEAAGSSPAPRSEGITGPQQRILDALSFFETIGIGKPTKTQLALVAKASPSSSSYTNNLGALRSAGLIDYPGPNLAALTSAGRALADGSKAPQTVTDMHAFVAELVTGPQWRILTALITAYPEPIGKDELAGVAGASAASSSYTNNLGSLRTLGLIDYPRPGHVVALPVLFLEAA